MIDRQIKNLEVNGETLQLGYFSLKLQKLLNRIWKTPSTYSVLLTQVGTNAPTAKLLNNSIGALIWSRISAGKFHLISSGLFLENKTTPVKDAYTDIVGNLLTIEWVDENTIELKTYATVDTTILADGVLTDQQFNIEIYNN